MFTLGIGMIIACVSVFLRDMFYIYSIIITIWNYLTPVFYSIEILPVTLQKIFALNPLYIFINGVREIVLFGNAPTIFSLLIMGIIGIVTLIIGLFIFKKHQDKFIYYI